MTTTDTLLGAISAFCTKHSITESRFGRLALKDTSFVSDLCDNDRAPTTRTIERVEQFMANYKKEPADVAG